jgi:hypothetical protein
MVDGRRSTHYRLRTTPGLPPVTEDNYRNSVVVFARKERQHYRLHPDCLLHALQIQ